MPKISVVTISFNQAQFLKSCIESVLQQRTGEVEHIVVDACSADGTPDVLDAYRDRLARVIVEKDSGPADGLNKGFSHATGDIFYYLNADDVVLPGAFEHAVRAFDRWPESDVIYGDGLLIDASGRVARQARSSPFFTPYSYVTGASMIVQQATFFRPDVFRAVGGFNVETHVAWDGELVFAMARNKARFRHVREFWGGFRIHSQSITGSGRLDLSYRQLKEGLFRQTYGRSPNGLDKAASLAMRGAAKLVNLHGRLRGGRAARFG